MNNTRNVLLVSLLLIALTSCEKAKDVLSQARSTLEEKVGSAGGKEQADEQKVDPELEALIDRNDEGVLFRRDLPFPGEVTVSVSQGETLEARIISSSELGKKVIPTAASRETSFVITKLPDSVRFAGFTEKYRETITKPDQEGPAEIRDHPLLPPTMPKDHTLKFRNGRWGSADTRGFAEVALAQQMGPHVDTILTEYGLMPRKMWFGTRRIQPGQTIAVSGELLPMLVTGQATGNLSLTFREIEPVHGHPCGKFSVTGSFSRKSFPSLDGRLFDEEVSIRSGEVWLSVIHPVILKSELSQIVRRTVAEGSGPSLIIQGNFESASSIRWEP